MCLCSLHNSHTHTHTITQKKFSYFSLCWPNSIVCKYSLHRNKHTNWKNILVANLSFLFGQIIEILCVVNAIATLPFVRECAVADEMMILQRHYLTHTAVRDRKLLREEKMTAALVPDNGSTKPTNIFFKPGTIVSVYLRISFKHKICTDFQLFLKKFVLFAIVSSALFAHTRREEKLISILHTHLFWMTVQSGRTNVRKIDDGWIHFLIY